eukprot:Skav219627  [mRNA]  locus=scaffold628:205596:206300:- [translate_table: standard]
MLVIGLYSGLWQPSNLHSSLGGLAAMSSGQPWKKQRLDEPAEPASTVLTFFSDGSFRRIPGPKESEVPRNRKQMTTVFAADGRYVHLEKPSSTDSCSAQKRSVQIHEAEGALAVRPASNTAVQGTGSNGTAKVEPVSGSTMGAMPIPPASKSWLDSRLENARSRPPPLVKRDDAPKSQVPAANVMVELHVAQRNPTKSTESAARLRINASSTDALDKVLTQSVGTLLSAIKPAL